MTRRDLPENGFKENIRLVVGEDAAYLMNDQCVRQSEKIKAVRYSEKTLEEILDMGLSEEWDADFGTGFINLEGIITSIYRSLK